jgi:hypothetical protein
MPLSLDGIVTEYMATRGKAESEVHPVEGFILCACEMLLPHLGAPLIDAIVSILEGHQSTKTKSLRTYRNILILLQLHLTHRPALSAIHA